MTSDAATLAAIDLSARSLRLPSARSRAQALAGEAERDHATYLEFLANVLAAESDDREERWRQRRIAAAATSVNAATIAMLKSGGYLERGEPMVMLGDSGTGKSHLLIGLGLAACEQGRSVRYATCAQMVNELVEAADERRLSRIVARYGRIELLLLDELGYVQLDTRGAELLFQILTEREEKSSVAVASNLPFSEWGQVVADPRLVAAIVDRLTFRAHIIETGTESFRLKSSRQSKRR